MLSAETCPRSWKDEEVKATPISTQDGSSARFAHLWTTDKTPWDNADERDLAQTENGLKLSNTSGSVLRIVDLPPNSNSPFHRTVSLDYGIVTKGECYLVLDDGKEVYMKEGDVAVSITMGQHMRSDLSIRSGAKRDYTRMEEYDEQLGEDILHLVGC